MRVLIAIPVFNERKYVEQVLRKVRRFHDEVLLIDDGSTDGTAEYLATRSDIHLIRHPENRGYGTTIRQSTGNRSTAASPTSSTTATP